MFVWQDLFIVIILPITIYFIIRYTKFFSFENKIITRVIVLGHLAAFVLWLAAAVFFSEPKDTLSYIHDARLLNYHLTHYSEFTPELWKTWQFQEKTRILEARISPNDIIICRQDGQALFYAKILAVLLWFTGHSWVILWFLLAIVSSLAHRAFIFWVSSYYSGHVFFPKLLLALWPSIMIFSTSLTKDVLLFPTFLFFWMDSQYLLSNLTGSKKNILRICRWIISGILLIIIKLYVVIAVWGALSVFFVARAIWLKTKFRWDFFLLISLGLGYHCYQKQFSFFYTIHQAYATRQTVLGDECKLENSKNTLLNSTFEVNYVDFFYRFPEAIFTSFPGPSPAQVNSTWLKILCAENIALALFLLVTSFFSIYYIRKISVNESLLLFGVLVFFGVIFGGYIGLSVVNAGSLMRYRVYALLPLLAGFWGILNQTQKEP